MTSFELHRPSRIECAVGWTRSLPDGRQARACWYPLEDEVARCWFVPDLDGSIAYVWRDGRAEPLTLRITSEVINE